MQSKNNTNINVENKKKYDAIVSYLRVLYHSSSKLFIRRPEEGIRIIELKNILSEENKYEFVKYLLNAEKEGAELYVKRPNDKINRVPLLETFHSGRIAKIITDNKKR